jgi:ribosomal subunit interface protein
VKVTFRNLPHSEALADHIEKRAAKLATFYDRITNCEVIVEVPHKHLEASKRYQIRIALAVPGEELMINHTPPPTSKYDNVYVAIREAFDEMRRRLQDYARLKRGDVKTHQPPPQGQVSRLFPQEGYGFIKLADGREIYFHQNSVVDGSFDRLELGATVGFVEEPGEEGPQAAAVQPVE